MPRDIERQVAENTAKRRRLESYSTSINNSGDKRVFLGGLFVEATASTAAVESRGLGGSMVVGSPRNENAVGRGDVGDNRGAWSATATGSAAAEGTAAGRSGIASSFVEPQPPPLEVAVGSGNAPPSEADASLSGLAHRGTATRSVSSGNESRTTAEFRFHEHGGAEEVGSFVGGGLAARAVPGAGLGPGEEARVTVGVSLDGDARGDASFTAAGETVLAALLSGGGSLLDRASLVGGGGNSITKTAQRVVSGETISLNVKFFENEPSFQPFDVVSVEVGAGASTTVLSSAVDTFQKDDSRSVDIDVGVRVV